MTKKELRERYEFIRSGIPREEKIILDRLIERNLFKWPVFQESKYISCYISFRSEIDTGSIIKKAIEMGKQLEADPSKFVPGGKPIATYKALGQSMVICIWEVPSLDALTPIIQQMNFMEWETEVIPVEKMSDFIPVNL